MKQEFNNPAYLLGGNARQRKAHRLLTEYGVLDRLLPYGALLVGTVPIGIDIPESDLDIVCTVDDREAFAAFLVREFGPMPGFSMSVYDENGTVVCGFMLEDEAVEVYASAVPTAESNGFRHMLAEARILEMAGDSFREEVVKLKAQGVKTEPAFAKLLNLDGDPYEVVLAVRELDEAGMKKILSAAKWL